MNNKIIIKAGLALSVLLLTSTNVLAGGDSEEVIAPSSSSSSSSSGYPGAAVADPDSCDDYESRSKCKHDAYDVGGNAGCTWLKACSWDDPRCNATPINPTDSSGVPKYVNCDDYKKQSTCIGDTNGKCI